MQIESDFILDSLRVDLTYLFTDPFEELCYVTKSGLIKICYDDTGKRTFTKVYCEGGITVHLMGKSKAVGINNDWWPNFTDCIKAAGLKINDEAILDLKKLGFMERDAT